MRRLILAAAFGVGALLIPSATTAHACGDAPLTDGPVYVVVGDGGAWLYAESGEAPGLQKGGTTLAGETAPCSDGGAYDTAIF